MSSNEHTKPSQRQDSSQSGRQGEPGKVKGKPASDQSQTRSGIGSSQAQDRASASEQEGARPSAGTPDIERGGPRDTQRGESGSTESLVNDLTGAFKERP